MESLRYQNGSMTSTSLIPTSNPTAIPTPLPTSPTTANPTGEPSRDNYSVVRIKYLIEDLKMHLQRAISVGKQAVNTVETN